MATASSSFNTPTLNSISSAANGIVTTNAAHGWAIGDVLRFQGLTEMTELNGLTRVVRTVPSSTTCTIGDTSGFTAESTGGADTCNLAVDVSGYLITGARGENVTVALSGTYSNTIHLERSLSLMQTTWEKVAPSDTWKTDNATVSFVYETQQDNEILRLVSTAATPTGTVAATLTDAAKVIHTFVDDDGNELFEITETGISFSGTMSVTGVITATGGLTGDVTGDASGTAATVTDATQAAITTAANLVTVGALASGSIASGFGTISTGNTIVTTAVGTDAGHRTTLNTGTSAASSVIEYGDGLDHTTVLTATALVLPAITEGANTAVGDLIYSFPTGAIILEWVYFSLSLDLNGTDQDAITAEIGLGQTIGTGAVARLASTPGFEDICQPRDVLCDGVAAVVQARVPTNGGPMFIASGDVRTVHVNIANGAAIWAAQSDGDGTSTYTGTVILHWKFLE